MNKIVLFTIFLFTVNCVGYQPIFSSKDFKYSFNEITYAENDKISKNISRKLINFSPKNMEKINIKINSKDDEIILSKDSKGDPLIFEINIFTEIKIEFNNADNKILRFNEKFSFNNQSNKFDLKRYKDSIKENLTNKIFDEIILQLRLL